MTIDTLIDAIIRNHFPNPGISAETIDEFERKQGWRLDSDLRAFYLRCNGASLFSEYDSSYRLLPLSEIRRARIAVFGEDSDKYGPESWYVICDNQDGDYTAIDVAIANTMPFPLFDVFHETFPQLEYRVCVARSFAEFLYLAIHSNNRRYWLSFGTTENT